MNDANPSIDSGSNATDFQPTTNNPQTGAANVQPSDGQTGAVNQAELAPNGQTLKVETAQSTDGSIPPFVTGVNPLLIVAIVVIALVVLTLLAKKLIKPAPVRGSVRRQVANEIAEARAEAEEAALQPKKKNKKSAKSLVKKRRSGSKKK